MLWAIDMRDIEFAKTFSGTHKMVHLEMFMVHHLNGNGFRSDKKETVVFSGISPKMCEEPREKRPIVRI